MPNSTNIFKKQIIWWINKYIPKTAKILDVGAGSGIWRHLLHNYPDMHAIEIFAPYVKDFHLDKLYNTVTTGNVIEQPAEFFEGYDLIIMGDVVEHMSVEDALKVIDKIGEDTTVIIGVPWGPQGIHNDNIYEIHIQDKLTNDGFLRDYPTFGLFSLHDNYAMYINKSSLASDEALFTFQLKPDELDKVVEDYPEREIIILDNDDDLGYIDYTLYGFV